MPVPVPAVEPQAPVTTLRPAFEAGTPLGIGEAQPEAAPSGPAEDLGVDGEALRAGYAAQVQRAVSRHGSIRRSPAIGVLEGRVALQLVLSPDGGLVAAQLVRSSGAMTLDRAALETVRRAKYPPVPPEIEDPRLTVAVEVIFTGSDR